MIIRDNVKNKIYHALNFDFFRYEDFSIEIADNKDGFVDECVFTISYDKYYFEIIFDSNKCRITFSPGDIYVDGSDEIKIDVFMKRYEDYIHEWLIRVKEDILNPVEKRFIDSEINKFKVEMEHKLEEIDDSYFTKEEGNELKERLEQLENSILEQSSQKELQTEIVKMKEEIKFLKETINTLSKKKWLRNALIRIWTWARKEENRNLIESSVETIKTISQMDIKL